MSSQLNNKTSSTKLASSSSSKPKTKSDEYNISAYNPSPAIEKKTFGSKYYCSIQSETYLKPDFPMYIAMANLCITPTGFADMKSRDAVCSKIQLMCGDVSHSYSNKTTHLVAAHANTCKVAMGRDRNQPIMTIEWVENIWNACQQNVNPYLHASLPEFQNFECPLFYNLSFVLSLQYTSGTRNWLQRLITEHGGIIVDKLKMSVTYVYICPQVEEGMLYMTAKKKKVPCLPQSWIVDSVSIQTLLPSDEYEVREFQGLGQTYEITVKSDVQLLEYQVAEITDAFARIDLKDDKIYDSSSTGSYANENLNETIIHIEVEENDDVFDENTTSAAG